MDAEERVKIGVVAHVGKDGAAEVVREVRERLSGQPAEAILEERTAQLIGAAGEGHALPELNQRVDYLLALGGDGTILSLVHAIDHGTRPKPICGVNLGRLGFLTAVNRQNLEHALRLMIERCEACYISRPVIRMELRRKNGERSFSTAVNEVTFTRGAVPRLIELEVSVDGKLLTNYHADGLIVATPTGSTAYSMAAGGPIMAPELAAFVMTPICPHVLTNRSLVVNSDTEITVRPRDRQNDSKIFVTVDGQEPHAFDPEDAVIIRRSPWDVRLALLAGDSFYEILREKLKWGGSAL
jgi:NAD+ kinase